MPALGSSEAENVACTSAVLPDGTLISVLITRFNESGPLVPVMETELLEEDDERRIEPLENWELIVAATVSVAPASTQAATTPATPSRSRLELRFGVRAMVSLRVRSFDQNQPPAAKVDRPTLRPGQLHVNQAHLSGLAAAQGDGGRYRWTVLGASALSGTIPM